MTTRGRVRVVLADDADDFRGMLRRALEHDGRFEVVGEAGDGDGLIVVADESRPDVVVLDLSMPGRSSDEVVPLLRAAAPSTRIVVLTGHDESAARGLDVDAVLAKTATLQHIVTVLGAPREPPPTQL